MRPLTLTLALLAAAAYGLELPHHHPPAAAWLTAEQFSAAIAQAPPDTMPLLEDTLTAPWLQPPELPPLPHNAVARAAARETVRQYLQNRADAGETAAQFRLGQWYASAADYPAARSWYEKAAPDPRAQTALALLDLREVGKLRARGEKAAAKTLREQAIAQLDRATRRQYAPAHFWLGYIATEDGAEKRAGYDWSRAVRQQHPDAMVGQGLIYLLPDAAGREGIAIHATYDYRLRTPQYYWAQAITVSKAKNPLAEFLLQLATKPGDRPSYSTARSLFLDYYSAYDDKNSGKWLRDLDRWPPPRDRIARHCPTKSMWLEPLELDLPKLASTPRHTSPDPATMRYWQTRAEAGDAAAQYRLGQMYARGEGYRQNLAVARAWYEQAAAQDYRAAHSALGILAENGTDSEPPDSIAAYGHYLQAAVQNDPVAQTKLGNLHHAHGDPAAAERWWQAAINQNHAAALRERAEHADDPTARQHDSAQAAALGDAIAMRQLGIATLNKNPARARDWLQQASDHGDGDASYRLAAGYYLADALALPSDKAKALAYAARAAAQGKRDAATFARTLSEQDCDLPYDAMRSSAWEKAARSHWHWQNIALMRELAALPTPQPDAAAMPLPATAPPSPVRADVYRRAELVPTLLYTPDISEPAAQYRVGKSLIHHKKTSAARDWLTQAAAHDHNPARLQLARLDHDRPGYAANAYYWLEQAALAGDSEAQLTLISWRDKDHLDSRHWEDESCRIPAAAALAALTPAELPAENNLPSRTTLSGDRIAAAIARQPSGQRLNLNAQDDDARAQTATALRTLAQNHNDANAVALLEQAAAHHYAIAQYWRGIIEPDPDKQDEWLQQAASQHYLPAILALVHNKLDYTWHRWPDTSHNRWRSEYQSREDDAARLLAQAAKNNLHDPAVRHAIQTILIPPQQRDPYYSIAINNAWDVLKPENLDTYLRSLDDWPTYPVRRDCDRDEEPAAPPAASNGGDPEKTIATYRAAVRGNADAQNNLGQKYARGDGISANHSDALAWLKQAAAQQQPEAHIALGLLAWQAGDRRRAHQHLVQAAKQGGGNGQYWLGELARADGDDTAALSYWHSAAAQKHSGAMRALGYHYAQQNDSAAAQQWLEQAASGGYADAQAQYLLGKNQLDRDPQATRRWWQDASANGSGLASYYLASGYAVPDALGLPQNDDKARAYAARAVSQGNRAAAELLAALAARQCGNNRATIDYWHTRYQDDNYWQRATLGAKLDALLPLRHTTLPTGETIEYSHRDDYSDPPPEHPRPQRLTPEALPQPYRAAEVAAQTAAAQYWQARAADGDAEAQYQLAQHYSFGEGVPLDLDAARTWYSKAAKQEHPRAQTSLGLLAQYHYQHPYSVAAAARYWWEKAAAQDETNAQNWLGQIAEKEEQYRLAQTWYNRAASGGNAIAMRNLALSYRFGHGDGEENRALEKYWLEQAVQQPHPDGYAMNELARAYSTDFRRNIVTPDREQAVAWQEKAEKAEDGEALNSLASRYRYGGEEKNEALETYYREKAYNRGYPFRPGELKLLLNLVGGAHSHANAKDISNSWQNIWQRSALPALQQNLRALQRY